MRISLLIGILVFLFASCSTDQEDVIANVDVQGHRGCRGLMPENTIPAMLTAMKIGVTTLEMDVVISKDRQVLLSHEPYMSSEICLDSAGNTTGNEKANIFELSYEEIKTYDCGTKSPRRFPDQEKIKVAKPLLSEVFAIAKEMSEKSGTDMPYFNIEIKSRPEWDGKYHPEVPEYCDLLVKEISKAGLKEKCIIQSFDSRTLVYLHENHPDFVLAYLTEDPTSWKSQLEELGFQPQIFSPYYPMLSPNMIKSIQDEGMKVIPWTINDKKDIEAFLKMGIDGIISDYPDRVMEILEELKEV
jgi:glycerophosphoryl diester phosphodiesterase